MGPEATIVRAAETKLAARLREPRRFMQVVVGPRQVGKTTAVRRALAASGLKYRYATADNPALRDAEWLRSEWDAARREARTAPVVLALDEAQKIVDWADHVKDLWDEDTRLRTDVRVVLLGSSPLLFARGLAESLAGRFEAIPMAHWSLSEMREGFGFDVDRFVLFGGYPGAAELVADPVRWLRYVHDALVETSISRDVLLLTRVEKPALLRRLFELSCAYSAQILSFNKMLGQLLDAGNTTTLAHYLELLAGAGLVAGLPKWTPQAVRGRASSPKLLVRNTALMTAFAARRPEEIRNDPALWGRWVESAVGAHLVNGSVGTALEVSYWRDARGREVDFVLRSGSSLLAVEVKTSRPRTSLSGLASFAEESGSQRALIVGPGGVPLEEFLSSPPESWL